MHFYYVKLSCPKSQSDGNDQFEKILKSCINKKISTFEITNIPNNINDLKINDLVIFMLSGDAANKRFYFDVTQQNLRSFENGIYAIARVISVTPSDKMFSAEFFPLEQCITKEQLYMFPQFADNLGVMTKGSPNQAGLYVIENEVFLSLLDYANQNNLINKSYAPFMDFKYEGFLASSASSNHIVLATQKLNSFNELKKIFLSNENEKVSSKNFASNYLINLFCEWFNKSEDEKPSYLGLVNLKVLKFWDNTYFNNQLFKLNPSEKNSELERIKNLVESENNNNDEWKEYSESTSKGSPKAVVGKKNYLKFLEEFINNEEAFEAYRNLFNNSKESLANNSIKLSKPFLLLAGISGSGKTRFIREQARLSGSLEQTYQLVPVRPDWHEPSDLLGYVSRLSGKSQYVVTDVLKFIVKAWQAIFNAGLNFDGKTITGNITDLATIPPYWLCLDELNLAPVEQYFADYLSVIETREWEHNADEFRYTCDAMLNVTLINEVDSCLRKDLGLDDVQMDGLWKHFCTNGICLPFNLIVAGTVNMDETTHGFSRKVIDRALSFDFGEFFPNDFDEYFASNSQNLVFTYPIWSSGRNLEALSNTIDKDGSLSINFLKSINKVLDKSAFKLAYRALNELLMSVIASNPNNERALYAVWDDFVMTKVLPRIEGDYDKLSVHTDADNGQQTILSELNQIMAEQLKSIWDGEQRPDLYREYLTEQPTPEGITGEPTRSKTIWIACRSNKKLVWMEHRLASSAFTSFWP